MTPSTAIRDYRGGGRSSARETAARVAAGAIARKVIPGVTIRAALVQMGKLRIDRTNWDWDEIGEEPVLLAPTPRRSGASTHYLDAVRKAGSSVGAVIEVVAEGVPAGWGAPIYGKLDAELASALMSVNAVKGVEIGDGFGAAELTRRGQRRRDARRQRRAAAVPLQPRRRHSRRHLDRPADRRALRRQADVVDPRPRAGPSRGTMEDIEIVTNGRHDPCVGIRAVPVAEAMVACVLADAFLRHRAQVGA